MSMVAEERETTITTSDADDTVRIWTAQQRYITRMSKNPKFQLVRSGHSDGTRWAEFVIPSREWNPATGAKRGRAAMSEEQRVAQSERLRRARAGR